MNPKYINKRVAYLSRIARNLVAGKLQCLQAQVQNLARKYSIEQSNNAIGEMILAFKSCFPLPKKITQRRIALLLQYIVNAVRFIQVRSETKVSELLCEDIREIGRGFDIDSDAMLKSTYVNRDILDDDD